MVAQLSNLSCMVFVLCGEYEASCIDCFDKGISTGSDTNASVLAASLNWTKQYTCN